MPVTNINVCVVSGNLTVDPDLRNTSSGHSVCELRLANNQPVKKDGKWESKANFFQINCWGAQGENCAKYLEKGSPVVVKGRLEWQMWEREGKTNSRVVIVAEDVQFGRRTGESPKAKDDGSDVPPPEGENDSGSSRSEAPEQAPPTEEKIGEAEDDIPF